MNSVSFKTVTTLPHPDQSDHDECTICYGSETHPAFYEHIDPENTERTVHKIHQLCLERWVNSEKERIERNPPGESNSTDGPNFPSCRRLILDIDGNKLHHSYKQLNSASHSPRLPQLLDRLSPTERGAVFHEALANQNQAMITALLATEMEGISTESLLTHIQDLEKRLAHPFIHKIWITFLDFLLSIDNPALLPLLSVLTEKRNEQIERQKVYDAIMKAIEEGNIAALQQLIQEGGVPSAYYESDALQKSVIAQQTDAVVLLLENYRPKPFGSQLIELLHFAIGKNDTATAQLLWKKLVNISSKLHSCDIYQVYRSMLLKCVRSEGRYGDNSVAPWIQLVQSKGITLSPFDMSMLLSEAIMWNLEELIPALIDNCSPSLEPDQFDGAVETALTLKNIRALKILQQYTILSVEETERLEEYNARHS